jgi:hypothetical protein
VCWRLRRAPVGVRTAAPLAAQEAATLPRGTLPHPGGGVRGRGRRLRRDDARAGFRPAQVPKARIVAGLGRRGGRRRARGSFEAWGHQGHRPVHGIDRQRASRGNQRCRGHRRRHATPIDPCRRRLQHKDLPQVPGTIVVAADIRSCSGRLAQADATGVALAGAGRVLRAASGAGCRSRHGRVLGGRPAYNALRAPDVGESGSTSAYAPRFTSSAYTG